MTKEIFISDDISQKIQKFDSIIFDCDGVLVDIRNSYDQAINKTISAIMKELFNDEVGDIVTSKIHFGLKSVGGFNDEVAVCLLYTSPSPRDLSTSRMPSSA